jgi:methyl acetate hydrolase
MTSSIDQLLNDAVANGGVPHVAAIAADRDGIIYEGGAGTTTPGGSEPVTTSTEFRIMSMTKMVCTVAALQQVERGVLELDAPVDSYRPEFAELGVLEGFDGDTPKIRPAGARATVRQLMTHTSGLAYWFLNEDLQKWETVTGVPNVIPGMAISFTAPLVCDPGSRFQYGINTDWLGKVVETVTGQTLDVVIKENITGPLGMDDTTFQRDEAQRANTLPIHIQDEDGRWGVLPQLGPWASEGELLNQAPDWWAGGHGLYSTPRDYIRFEQALLRNGELGGERILATTTVDQAFTNQIGELDFPPAIRSYDAFASHDINLGPGLKWGLGLLLNTADTPGMRRAGSGAWAGLCNTHFWVDRTTGICASIYTNSLPFVPPAALQMYAGFEQALYASL